MYCAPGFVSYHSGQGDTGDIEGKDAHVHLGKNQTWKLMASKTWGIEDHLALLPCACEPPDTRMRVVVLDLKPG